MSLFSIVQEAQVYWNSHSHFKNVVTGNFIGNYFVDNVLKKFSPYMSLRDNLASRFSERLAPRFKKVSNNLAKKALEPRKIRPLKKSVLEKGVHSLLFPVSPLSKTLLNTISSGLERAHLFLHPLQNKIVHNTRQILVSQLEPVCEKAIYQAFTSLLKNTGESAVDFTAKQISSTLAVPLIYSTALRTINYAITPYTGNFLADEISVATEYLPSSSTILWGSVALHATLIASTIWHATQFVQLEEDKPKVQKIVYNASQASIAAKLKEIKILTIMRITQNPERVEKIVRGFTNRLVNYYWDDLQDVKFLGFPLVI